MFFLQKIQKELMRLTFSLVKSLKDKINFNLLLDVAHLKVSAKSLGLNWKNELEGMMDESDYIHISDNDGFHDLNNKLTKGSDLLSILKNFDTKNKDFTLEVYGDINSVKSSYESLQLAIL